MKLVGVCFESHPRYIVLELLEGGDLKTFLREMRPKTVSHPHQDPCNQTKNWGDLQVTVEKLFPFVGSIGITRGLSTNLKPLRTSQGSAMQTKFV